MLYQWLGERSMEIKITTLKDMSLKGEELTFDIDVAAPPPTMKTEDLEKVLQKNRELLDEYLQNMTDSMRNDYIKRVPPWDLAYQSLLKNAATARLTIDKLIPIIHSRGGHAQFTQLETKAAALHVEILMKKAEKKVLSEVDVTAIPMSTVAILTFLVACAALSYLYLVDSSF